MSTFAVTAMPMIPVASHTAAVPASAHARLRITQRGRRVLLALAAVPLAAGALALALNGGSATATSEDVATEYVTVASGQSLWSLAESIAPESDPREVIDDIVALNHMSTAELQAGQMLAVPSRYAD
jgi:hypothetical protein